VLSQLSYTPITKIYIVKELEITFPKVRVKISDLSFHVNNDLTKTLRFFLWWRYNFLSIKLGSYKECPTGQKREENAMEKLKKTSLIALTFSLIFTVSSCNNQKTKSESGQSAAQAENAGTMQVDSSGLSKTKAILKTVHGNIVFKFYPKKAPNTVTRISELIKQGFYDGLTFHRVVPNFVIQGGDPTATGTGGSGQKLKAEFNDIQHIKGTVAMARAQDKDSADSQFYVALTNLPHLDRNYTVFGQVIEGIEILEKVQQGDKMLSLSLE
jgi:cyclophilin family peptidyl-prolyl cis-trans isomerase